MLEDLSLDSVKFVKDSQLGCITHTADENTSYKEKLDVLRTGVTEVGLKTWSNRSGMPSGIIPEQPKLLPFFLNGARGEEGLGGGKELCTLKMLAEEYMREREQTTVHT